MRRTWMGIQCVACLLMVTAGCITPSVQKKIKPPEQPQVVAVPPDDNRYSLPPDYPKGVLNKDTRLHDLDDPEAMGKGQGGKMGLSGAGMGGGQ